MSIFGYAMVVAWSILSKLRSCSNCLRAFKLPIMYKQNPKNNIM